MNFHVKELEQPNLTRDVNIPDTRILLEEGRQQQALKEATSPLMKQIALVSKIREKFQADLNDTPENETLVKMIRVLDLKLAKLMQNDQDSRFYENGSVEKENS